MNVNQLAQAARDAIAAEKAAMYGKHRRAHAALRRGYLNLLERRRERAASGAARDRIADLIVTLEHEARP